MVNKGIFTSLAEKKKNYKINWGNLIIYILLFIGVIIIIFPVVFAVLSSFKTEGEITKFPPTFFPHNPTFENYITTWTEINFSTFLRNTALLSIIIVLIVCYVSALTGYVLGKLRFKGRNIIFLIVVSTMMFPWSITIIVLFKMMMKFNWSNTYLPLIIPSIFSAFGIFLLRQFSLNIPDDIIDAARVDGASESRIFHQIILPMLQAPIAALAIFIFLGVWDDFLWPYLNLNSEKLFTVNLGLNSFIYYEYSRMGPLLSATSLVIIPILIFYFIFQRKFIEGISLSGLKE